MPNVYLVGMPGSGKTTVGRILAAELGTDLVDLDAEVVRAAGRSIERIYATDGERRFRELEQEALATTARLARAVVACGGGVVLRASNRRTLARAGTVVYLRVPTRTLVERVRGTSGRPILAVSPDFVDVFRERRPLYEEVADVVVDGTRSPRAVADVIARRLPPELREAR